MSVPKHIVLDHGGFMKGDGLHVAAAISKANVIGGGAGLAVVTAVVLDDPMPDATYGVVVTPGQDATAFVSGKTRTGFNVTLTPRLAATTLAVGTFDCIVFA